VWIVHKNLGNTNFHPAPLSIEVLTSNTAKEMLISEKGKSFDFTSEETMKLADTI
jgi:hypothetical protein